jgi:hypothetical protein
MTQAIPTLPHCEQFRLLLGFRALPNLSLLSFFAFVREIPDNGVSLLNTESVTVKGEITGLKLLIYFVIN